MDANGGCFGGPQHDRIKFLFLPIPYFPFGTNVCLLHGTVYGVDGVATPPPGRRYTVIILVVLRFQIAVKLAQSHFLVPVGCLLFGSWRFGPTIPGSGFLAS